MKVKTILITFNNLVILKNQISDFRSFLNKQLDYQADILHNHTDDGEIYRYPLVQFRSVAGKAVLFGIGEGVGFIKKLIVSDMLPAEFRADIKMEETETEIGMSEKPITYSLNHYLPLNTDNYESWKKQDDLIQRTTLLQKVTVGHLLNFCTEMGFKIPNKSLTVKLKRVDTLESVKLKASGNEMQFLCFNVTFEANLTLPTNISLGKGKSKGYGVLEILTNNTEKQKRGLIQNRAEG